MLPIVGLFNLIQSALETAVKAIRDDDSIKIEPVIDRDTMGIPGSPDIADTILAKIEKSQIFVADVSIINSKSKSRKTPNPNVLVELGFAMKSLDLDRIIMVMNTAYGKPEALPFDLRMRRVVSYSLSGEENEKASERKKLGSILEQAIRVILDDLSRTQNTEGSSTNLLEQTIQAITTSHPSQTLLTREYVKILNDDLIDVSPPFPGSDKSEQIDETLIQSINASLNIILGYSRLVETMAVMDAKDSIMILVKNFEKLLGLYEIPIGFSGVFQETRLDFFKFIGHELFVILISFLMRENRWELITKILEEGYYVKRPSRGAESLSFENISDYVRILDTRNKRLDLKRISLHADILNERYSKGQLSEICPMEQFISADLLLYLRAGFEWRPWSSLYLYENTPRFLIDAARVRYAEQLFQPLKVKNIDELKELLKKHIPQLHKFYSNRGFFRSSLDYFNIDTIGSK